MASIISIQRGDITISANYDALQLTSASSFEKIERTSLDIMRREYQTSEKTRLLDPSGNFAEVPSLLRAKYGQYPKFGYIPLRPAIPGTSTVKEDYLSRNEALELARSIYDQGDSAFGDELTKFLYVVLTSVGAEGPMLGLFDRRPISVGSKDEPLRGSHGVVLHVDGKELQKSTLKSIGFPEPHYFTGFLCFKLPYLIGQYPEAVVLSDIIPRKEYHTSLDLRQSLESALGSDSALFLTETAQSGDLHVATKPHLHIGSPVQNIIDAMQNIERTSMRVSARD